MQYAQTIGYVNRFGSDIKIHTYYLNSSFETAQDDTNIILSKYTHIHIYESYYKSQIPLKCHPLFICSMYIIVYSLKTYCFSITFHRDFNAHMYVCMNVLPYTVKLTHEYLSLYSLLNQQKGTINLLDAFL